MNSNTSIPEAPMSSAPQTPRTIRIVEDNEVTREGLAAILRGEGYAVALAANGQAALDYLRDNPPLALVILDMLMPGLDGWGLLEELRRLERPPAVPILIVTATLLTGQWAIDHGCVGLVHKPVVPEELLAEVRRCVGAAAG
jgi:CheY-like chemotaxis protein